MHVRCARLVTPDRFAVDRELALIAGKQRRPPSMGRLACAPGYECMCVADERARTRARRTGVPSASSRRGARLSWRSGITHGAARGHAHQLAQRERGDGGASLGETHLIIARFRHLAPALNNALALTHSLLPPLSIRPLCASMGRRDGEVHGAFDPAAGIISRCVRRVASAPCPPPYGAASHRSPPRENGTPCPDASVERSPGPGPNDRRTTRDRCRPARLPHSANRALPHGRMNERRAALANEMRKRPRSTAPDQRLTENAGPIAARGACADPWPTRPARPIGARRHPRSRIARQSPALAGS